jgi:hypothetical protein
VSAFSVEGLRRAATPAWHALLDVLLGERFRRREKQRLGDPHGLGQTIVARRPLAWINVSKELRQFRQNQILLVRPASPAAQPRTSRGKTSGPGDLRLIQSGEKAAS